MKDYPTILFLGDGMADEPLADLQGQTPLQAAHTPFMDSIARRGRSGTMLTLPEGFATSSDIANMSVLGCDLARESCGRGPLEALAQNLPLAPDELVFRINLITLDEQGILKDFAGGHPTPHEATATIALLNRHLASAQARFYVGVSYRNLLVIKGDEFQPLIHDSKPDDCYGLNIAHHLPQASAPAGEKTASFLRALIQASRQVLQGRQANAIWPWSGGRIGALHNLAQKYNVKAAVISAVDVINGLGQGLGMDVIRVPGATGYVDTNYEGKADAALQALRAGYDFIYVHLEAIDEVSHAQDLQLKLRAIEDFDRRLVGRVMQAAGDDIAYCVLPDHPVPLASGKHTRTPVPVSVYQPGVPPDQVTRFDETAVLTGALGHLRGSQLTDLLLG